MAHLFVSWDSSDPLAVRRSLSCLPVAMMPDEAVQEVLDWLVDTLTFYAAPSYPPSNPIRAGETTAGKSSQAVMRPELVIAGE